MIAPKRKQRAPKKNEKAPEPQPIDEKLVLDGLIAAQSPLGWAEMVTRNDPVPYLLPRHIRYIDRALRELEAATDYDTLIITAPVQHGKSLSATTWYPAWFLCSNPEKSVGVVSYNTEYAGDKFGRPARDFVDRAGPAWFGVAVDRRSSARDLWTLAGHQGQFVAAGIEKGLTGRRADRLIVDDPYATIADAESPEYRQKVWDAWQFEIATRLAPNSKIVVIMSRWHEDDFAGRLMADLKERGKKFVHVDLPALALENDPLGRAVGEALWPEVRPKEWLEEQRDRVGPRAFDALFQGRPRPAAGQVFQRQWFRYYTIGPDGVGGIMLFLRDQHGQVSHTVRLSECRIFSMCDLAIGETKAHDFSCYGTFAMTPRRDLVILDMIHDRIPGLEQVRMMFQMTARWRSTRVGIEDTQFQKRVVQDAVVAGLPAVGISRKKDSKLTRSYVAQARYEMGTVYHPQSAPWLGEFEHELLKFPVGKFDDYVDVVSDAAAALMTTYSQHPPTGQRIGERVGVRA